MFIRYEIDRDWVTTLMGMNLGTGVQETLADLSSPHGSPAPVFDYAVHGDRLYYVHADAQEASGFYVANLDGRLRAPVKLLDVRRMREDGTHPYMASLMSVQISSDGRWACLSVVDQRLMARDIPFADDPESPQPDPRSATSLVSGLPWVPCHNVILYDLENNEIVDPFIERALQPHMVIVTGATFAPDGRSLLCAVLGDGGDWRMFSFFDETTLYQIRLDDGSFDAIRVFQTDLPTSQLPEIITWLESDSILIRSMSGIPPLNPVQIAKPAAFE